MIEGVRTADQFACIFLPGVNAVREKTEQRSLRRIAFDKRLNSLFPPARALFKIRRENQPVGRDDKVGSSLFCSGNERFGILRQQAVVAVHELDVFAARQIKPAVAGVRNTGVGFVDHSDAGILRRQLPAYGQRTVRGAVVQDEDLQRGVSLPADALKTVGGGLFGVVDRNDDAYERI